MGWWYTVHFTRLSLMALYTVTIMFYELYVFYSYLLSHILVELNALTERARTRVSRLNGNLRLRDARRYPAGGKAELPT